MSRSSSGDRSRVYLVMVQVVLLLALALFFLRRVDREEVLVALREVGAWGLISFGVAMMAVRFITAWRWSVVSRRHLELPAATTPFLFQAGLLAEFAGISIQTTMGAEAVRIWKLARRCGDKGQAVASVLIDRSVGTLSLLLVTIPLVPVLLRAVPAQQLPSVLTPWSLSVVLVILVAGLLGWWKLAFFRRLVQSAWSFLRRSYFFLIPLLISLLSFPLVVAAHIWTFPELAAAPWAITATVVLVPRLGRAVPLSALGVTAVEGSTLVVGSLLGISSETLLLAVALNVAVKYVAGGSGLVWELALHGRRALDELRGPAVQIDEQS